MNQSFLKTFSKSLFCLNIIFIYLFAPTTSAFAAKKEKSFYPTYIDLTAKPGSQRNIGELNLLAPFAQSENKLTFFNLRGQVDNNDSSEINLGLGQRRLLKNKNTGHEAVLGYYGFLDARNSENGNKFYQVTVGGEFLSEYFDYRNNFYAPINQEEDIALQNQRLVNEGNTINMQFQNKEKALHGADFEFGTNLPWLIPFNKNKRNQLRVYAGAYYFTNSGVKSVAGPRARAELRLYEFDRIPFMPVGSVLTISGEYQTDNVRGHQKYSGLRLSIPLQKVSSKQRLSGARLRMVDPVIRDVDIVNSNVTSSEQAILPSGQNLTAINEADDAVSLYQTTTQGADNSLVIVKNDISTSLSNKVQSGQTVTVPGQVIRIATASGISMNYVVPGSVSTKVVTSLMPGQIPLELENNAQNTVVSSNITTKTTDFAGNIRTNSPMFGLSIKSTAEIATIQAGTVLATIDVAQETTYAVGEVFNVGTVTTGPVGCATGTPDGCFEIDVNGNFKVKAGVVFAAAPEVLLATLNLTNNGTTFSKTFVATNVTDSSTQYTDAITALLPNEETYKGVRLLYGSDFAANNNEKINHVKHIISNLLGHDNNTKGGVIQAKLLENGATMTLFNDLNDLDSANGTIILGLSGNTQDLQADEVFTGSFAADRHGRNAAGTARDAALEEITHLIHNYGITDALTAKQVELDAITVANLATGDSAWTDVADQDGIEDGFDLPRVDVDDELFAGAVESYLDFPAGGGADYLDDNDIFQAPFNGGLVGAGSSSTDLQNNHSDAYNLVNEIFGPRVDLLTRMRATPDF